MRQLPFQIANLASAVLWATGVLTPGIVAIEWLL
jgi:membrane protein DedA with SNARE-associated domain